MKNFTRILLTACLFLVAVYTKAQTTLISASGDGGFENGTTLPANNWTVVNGSQVRPWTVGTSCTGFTGSRAAYITQDGTNYADGNSTGIAASVVHFYRDITFPAGETNIVLTFNFKQPTLDATFDFLKIYVVDVSTTPVAGTQLSSGQIGIEYPSAATANFTSFSASIPGSNAGTTKRIVFSYKTDGSSPYGSGGIDDISLVSSVPVPYYWIGGASGSWATSTNWSPTRTTPNAGDVLIINATNNSGNTTTTLTNVPTQTIASLQVTEGVTANLQSAASSNTLTISSTLDVAATNTLNINGANSMTMAFTSGSISTIGGTLGLSGSTSNTYNPTNGVTTVTGTVNNGGIMSSATATTLIFSAGSTYNHVQNGGTVPTANYAATSNCNITGITSSSPTFPLGVSVGNFTWNCSGQTINPATLSSNLSTIAGTCNIISTGAGTGTFQFGTSPTLSVAGLTTVSGGTLNAAGGTLNFNGGFTQSGGTVTGTGTTTITTTNFTQSTGTFTGGTFAITLNVSGSFNQSAGTIAGGTSSVSITYNGTSNQGVTIGGSVTGTVNVRVNNGTNGITITGTLPINSGATMTVSGTGTQVTGTVSYNASSSTLIYNASGAQTTGNEFPSSSGPTSLTINNTAGVSLSGSRTLSGTTSVLTLTAGVLNIGSNDLTLGSTTTISVSSPSATKMVQADGSGQLKKTFATGDAASFTFPIGDATGTAEYSPATIDFATNSVSRTIGIRVTDGDHPSNSATDRISRYWSITDDQAGTYTYTGNFTYVAADIVGTEGSMRLNRWNGSAWTQIGSSAGSNALTISSATNETTGTLGGNDFTGRTLTAQTYTWNQVAGGTFSTAGNWTPNRSVVDNTDVLIFDGSITTSAATVTGVTTQSIAQLKLTNNANVTLQSSATATITIGGAAGTDLDVPAGSTLNLGGATNSIGIAFTVSTTADISGTFTLSTTTGTATYTATNSATTVSGTFNLSTTTYTVTSTASNLSFLSGSNCNMTTSATTIPLATWNANSNLNITGIGGGTSMTNAAQTFGNILYNCPAATGTMSLFTTNTVSIGGNLTIQATNTGKLRLVTSGTLSIAGNLNVIGGTCDISSSGGTVNVTGNFSHSSTGTTTVGLGAAGNLNVTGNVTVSSGTFDLNSSTTAGILKVGGTFNHSGGTFTTSGSSTTSYVEFNGSAAQSVTPGTIGGTTGYRVNNAAGITITGTLTVNNLATLTMVQGAITGTVAYTNTTATGAILVYAGTAAQTTADAEFPAASGPGSLTINNTAGVSLHAARTVNPPVTANIALTLTAGVLSLGNNDLTIGANGTISVTTPSATKMVQITGTGQLKKIFPSGASSAFTFPVGENTGTVEYSPIAFTFSANSVQRTIGVSVVDADPPSNGGSTTYISRYWPITNSASGTYTYSGTMVYTDADINGAEASLLVQFYNGSVYSDVTSTVTVASNTLNITTGTDATTAFDNTGNTVLTGRRSAATPYVWNGSTSGDWGTAANWTPSGIPGSIDNITINVPGTNPLVINSARSVTNFTLNGTGTFTLNAATTLTVNGTFTYDNSSGANASLNCTSTVDFAASGATSIPALSYGNLTRSGTGTTTLSSTGTISICTAFTAGTATYVSTGSTVDFTSASSQTIPGISYNNLSNSGNGPRTLSNTGTIGIGGTYTPTTGAVTVGTSTINFSSAGAQTIPATSYYNITSTGNGARTLASSGTIFIAAGFSPGSGSQTTTGSTINYNGSGSYTLGAYPYNNLELSGTATFTLGASVNLAVGGNFTMSCASCTFNLAANSGTSNTMTVSGNFDMTSGCTSCLFNVANLTTSTGGTLNVNGNMTLAGGSSAELNLEKNATSATSFGVVNVLGNFTATGTNTSGIVDFGDGDNQTGNRIAISGNFSKSGTGTFYTTGSPTGTSIADGFVFNKAGSQTFSYSGTASSYTNWVVENGSTLMMTTGLAMGAGTFAPIFNFTVKSGGTLDMGLNVLSGGNSSGNITVFNLASGSTIKTANATGITGSLTGFSGTRTLSSASNYEFQGAATGTFTTSPTLLRVNNLTINNASADVTMNQAFTVAGDLNMTAGRLLMVNNSLTVLGVANVAGFSAMSNDANSYVVTSGTGLFGMALVSGVAKVFPVGLTGTENTFNPIQLKNTGAGGNFFVHLDNTVDNPPSDPTRIVKLDYDVTSAVTPISLAMATQWEAINQATNFLPSNPVVIGHFTGGVWEPNSCTVSSNGGTHPFYASTIADFTSLSPFTPANSVAFPLELISFDGKTLSRSNLLQWETLSEKNVQSHIVERSVDGIDWKEVGRKAGQIESHVSFKYELEDRTPPAKAYYRLRSVDYDGQENLSNSILLTRKNDYFGITAAFPSPTKDKLTVQFASVTEEEITVRITDLAGRFVFDQKFAAANGINEVPVQLNGLQAGMYLVSIFNATTYTEPVRIIKE